MIVLGINDGHCATAALLKDGEVLGCVSEERFTRNKNESGYPRLSIEWLLASQRLKPQELDAIALAGEEAIEPAWFFRVTRDDAYIDEYLGLRDGGPGGRLREKLRRFFSKLSLTSEQRGKRPFTLAERHRAVREHLGVEEGCIHQVEHHTAHAAAAYWASPYGAAGREATILTNDAAGDGLCATWSIGGRQGLKRLSASPSAAGSLGSFYSLVTLFLGMRQLEHEYKVMGLAPYAPEAGIKRSYEVFRQMIEFSPGDPPCFRWKVRRARFRYMMERLARHRFDWVAAAAQSLLEEMLEEWAVLGLERAGSPRLACSGGVFMNVKANKRLSELAQVEELYVLPSCGDESNAIGAAYSLYHELTGEAPKALGPLYLGPSFGDEEIGEMLEEAGAKTRHRVERLSEPEEKVASLLAGGEVVARFSGGMEFGARALGNRSILADPRDYRVVRLINKMIKCRDFWMPFAPTILKERAGEYLVNPKELPSPYMMLAFDSSPKGRELLPAASHPYDGTVRPQILEEGDNPSYFRLVKAFEGRTGLGAILNTSFNLHGEPIVCSPADALRTFELSGLPHLALGSYLVSKRG